jgi:hypothetical protein
MGDGQQKQRVGVVSELLLQQFACGLPPGCATFSAGKAAAANKLLAGSACLLAFLCNHQHHTCAAG